MIQAAPDMRDQSSRSNPSHICPLSSIAYRGDCPLTSCPANLSSLSGGMRQGCFFCHSDSATLHSISHILGVSEKDVSRDYESGMHMMNHIGNLLDIANTYTPFCKYCGFPGDECFDEDRCEFHTGLVESCIQKKPYSIKEFGFTKEGIWRIAVTRPSAGSIPTKMREYVKRIREDEGFNTPTALEPFL